MSIHDKPIFRNCINCDLGKNSLEIKELWHKRCSELDEHSDWKFCNKFHFLVTDNDGCTFGRDKEIDSNKIV